MSARWAAAAVLGFHLLAAPTGVPASVASQGLSVPTRVLSDLGLWFGAVDRHEAGTADEAAASIAPWSIGRLTGVLSAVKVLRAAMAVYDRRPSAVIILGEQPLQSVDVERLLRITTAERLAADLERVLRRAAMLHADIARFAPDLPAAADGGVTVHLSDGQQTATGRGTAHWRFGRDLLAALKPGPLSVRFTSAWYSGTAAHMQSERMLSLADQHLTQARSVAPDDPDILFAAACALETLASRRIQAEMQGIALQGHKFEVRPVRVLEDEAVALFRQVLARDPDRREARVRLARLLGTRGSHAEAAAELRRALQPPIPEGLAYFGWLFAGDEALALGEREAARLAYERAAELFPGAAAPIVALVRLAREHADRDAVAAALRRWWALPAGEADPWGEYYLMQGGDVVERMQAVYDLAGVCLGKLGPSRPPTIGVIQP